MGIYDRCKYCQKSFERTEQMGGERPGYWCCSAYAIREDGWATKDVFYSKPNTDLREHIKCRPPYGKHGEKQREFVVTCRL